MTDANHAVPLKALVTGATAGLGRAIAIRLARDGMNVIVVGRNQQRGAEVVTEISNAGGEARFVAADMTSPSDISRLANDVGAIDVLVNNAGHSVWGPTETFAVADIDGLFASNVRGPFLMVAAFAPAMVSRGSGSIINVSSMAARIGLANGAAYGASKAALVSLTQSWTAEYSPKGVRVNVVTPGPIYTRPEARELFDTLGATTALKRAAEPEEIAEVIAFLASPAASYVSGAIIAADGGRTAI